MKPLYCALFFSGMYSLPTERGGKCGYVWKKALNVLWTVACCGSLCLRVVAEAESALSSGSVASLYLTTFTMGEAFLAIAFRCRSQKALAAFLEGFECYQRQHGRSEVKHRTVLVAGIVAIAMLVGSVGVSLYYGLAKADASSECSVNHRPGFLDTVHKAYCHPVFRTVSTFFLSQVFNVAFWLYVSVWKILQTEANDIVENLTKHEKATLGINPEAIEHFRLRHADLCHVITRANRFVGHILAAAYGAGVACVLLIIHGFIYKLLVRDDFSTMAYFFILIAFEMIVLTLTGSSLNLKVIIV